MQKKVLVIGASENPERYSNKAIQLLNAHGYPLIAIGLKNGHIGNTKIVTERSHIADLDTVSLYINPLRQPEYYDYLLDLHPKRIIFNPGAENAVLKEMAQDAGIMVMEACTLVLLHTGQF